MHAKKKVTVSMMVKDNEEKTRKTRTALVVTGKDGQKWQLHASLEDIMEEAGLSEREAWQHFMQVAKLCKEGRMDPETLHAFKIV